MVYTAIMWIDIYEYTDSLKEESSRFRLQTLLGLRREINSHLIINIFQ